METGADQNGPSLCLLFPVGADAYGPSGEGSKGVIVVG